MAFLLQETVLQSAINWNDMTCSLRHPPGNQQKDRFGLVFGFYVRLCERPFGVEARQPVAQVFG